MTDRFSAEEYSRLIGKKWRNLNQADNAVIPMLDKLDDHLLQYILVSGEDFFRDSKEGATEFQTEDLIANPETTHNHDEACDEVMLIITLGDAKNFVILTEQVSEAATWIEELKKLKEISVRYAYHKVKAA